jgi:hypothetical protein
VFVTVSEWLADPPVGPRIIGIAKHRWVSGEHVDTIVPLLKLDKREELYQLRVALGWPKRDIKRAGGRPLLEISATEEQLELAREQWDRQEMTKVIQRTLGLAERRQVYTVARRLGWPPRRQWRRRPRAEWPSTLFKQGVRRALGEISSGERPITNEDLFTPAQRATKQYQQAQLRRLEDAEQRLLDRLDANRLAGILQPPERLVHVCPGCEFRVAPDPEHSRWVGPQLYHARCAPAQAA